MEESLLDNEFLARLEYLYVVTRELFFGHISADRISKKFGVGMEFADYRPYASGDDFRYIDWFAYARRGELLIKLFSEEHSARIYVLIDASRSMATGRPEKLLYAKKIAAALGYISLTNLDPVTMVTFDGQLRTTSRLFQGRGHLRQMITHLQSISADGDTTAMGRSVNQFVRRFASSRGRVVLVSDFLDRAGYEEAIRLLHYHHFDLVAIQVNSREELDPPFTGDLELVDAESGQPVVVRMTPGLIASYKRRLADHYHPLAQLTGAISRPYLPVTTDTPFEELIFDVFRRGALLR